MIQKFQKEYENFWKNGDDIQEAEHRLNHLYMMRDRRLGKEEMDAARLRKALGGEAASREETGGSFYQAWEEA